MATSEIVDLTKGVYRRLYAGCCKGKRINSVSVFAELLFWRLHCIADDFGTFEAEPVFVKSQAFPIRRDVSEGQISAAIVELSAAKLIELFECKSEKYGVITDFLLLQPANKNGRRIQKFPTASQGILVNPGESGGSAAPHTHTHTHTHTQSNDGGGAPMPPSHDSEKPKRVKSSGPTPSPEIPPKLTGSPKFIETWELWRKHLYEKLKGKQPGPTALSMQLKRLAEIGPSRAINAITHSIEKNWQSIYESDEAIAYAKANPPSPPMSAQQEAEFAAFMDREAAKKKNGQPLPLIPDANRPNS